MLAGRLKLGPAARSPLLNRLLHKLGVLDRRPEEWAESPRLGSMRRSGPNYRDAVPPAAPPPGFDGPWPQAPLVDPRFAPPVLHLDAEERGVHLRYNVSRYVGQLLRLAPGAALRSLLGRRLAPMTDATFSGIFDRTSLGQFIDPDLDEADRRSFAPYLDGPLDRYARIDLSATSRSGLPGVHLAPTVTLVRRGEDGRHGVVAIRIGDRTLDPSHGAAWQLARYFVLQGAQLHLVCVVHPLLHFPGDVVNAVTRTLLPRGHVVHRLLEPHMEWTLGLHEAVVHNRRSVLHNSQRELYTPFPAPTEVLHDYVARGLEGGGGAGASEQYRFDRPQLGTHTEYGRYRRDWYEAVLELTSAVAAQVPPGDVYVERWADAIRGWLPGFPGGAEIFRGGRLAESLATYVSSVSVFHTADHHSYTRIPADHLPWRLRVPSPDVEEPRELRLRSLVSAEDHFRHLLCRAMFFEPVILSSLHDVEYGFRNPALRRAAGEFRAAMRRLDERWSGSTFPRSDEIAASLQY